MKDLVLSVFDRCHIMGIVVLVLELWMGHTISVVRVMMAVMLVRIVMLEWCLIRRIDLVLLTVVIDVMSVLLRAMDSMENSVFLVLNWCDVVGIVVLVLKLGMSHVVVAMVLLWVMGRLTWQVMARVVVIVSMFILVLEWGVLSSVLVEFLGVQAILFALVVLIRV